MFKNPGFTCIGCRPYTKKQNKERIQKFKEIRDSWYIYQNELNKVCFQETCFMEILKILLEEKILIKYCMIKHLILLKIQNMIDIKGFWYQWFINEDVKNQGLAEELYKPIEWNLFSSFMDNIWGANLADMQLFSKFNKGIRFLLCYWSL